MLSSQPKKRPLVDDSHSSDSEDDKPLSFKRHLFKSNKISKLTIKETSKSTTFVEREEPPPVELAEEKPISYKRSIKSKTSSLHISKEVTSSISTSLAAKEGNVSIKDSTNSTTLVQKEESPPVQRGSDSEDSADEKPLSYGRSIKMKNNSAHISKDVTLSSPSSLVAEEGNVSIKDSSTTTTFVKKEESPPVEPGSDSEGSADEKPLCYRRSIKSKNNSLHISKGVTSSTPSSLVAKEGNGSIKESSNSTTFVRKEENPQAEPRSDSEGSGDEKPLSYGRSIKSKNNSLHISKKDASSTPSSLVAEEAKVSIKDSSNLTTFVKKEEGHPVDPGSDSEDSGDEKPLCYKRSIKSKNNSTHISKEVTSMTPSSSMSKETKVSIKECSESSEDEIPLSSKFRRKPSGSAYGKKSCDFENERPIASKVQQNGVVKKDEEQVKSTKSEKKRPLSVTSNSAQSAVKKPKPSSASVTNKVKQAVVKAKPKIEYDDEDDDGDDDDSDDGDDDYDADGDDDYEDDEYAPNAQRMKKSSASNGKSPVKKTPTKVVSSSVKKTKKKSKKIMKKSKYSKSTKVPPSSGEGQKWTTLVHSGVIFPPPYQPHGVKMLYNGKPVDLTPEQEEVATMFAVMKDTDYAAKPKFIENFMNDWRVILGKNHVIKKFELCDFTPIYEWHQKEKEKKKQMTTEEKKFIKEEKLKQEDKYMWAIVDGVKEKVGNFRVEPPGLFRGRGEHPKMGKLKRRIRPRDITINIGKDAPVPECPIPGERWKEVRHDNTVTWLAFWIDPINSKEFKYVFLAASSSLKGQSDKEKYEKARLLKDYIHNIRANYTKDFRNKDNMKRQIAIATYLIDKLALRAGNEKDDDEADTVGCCTLKVENITLMDQNKIQFDFLGKDSIRYFNTVEVEVPVYEAIKQFRSGKKEGDDLFDKLDTSKLNAHLKELMPGLTAKVFRTYNASITLDEMLNRETKGSDVAEKIVHYQHANKEVAIICNHQRTVSKAHSAQMSKLNEKMDELKAVLDELKTDLMRAKKGKPPLKDADGKPKKALTPEVLERKIAQTNGRIKKIESDMQTKEDLKAVALGTSKINYLDPRISVAWCKRREVPIEKIFNKSLLAKFAWAMDVDLNYRF